MLKAMTSKTAPGFWIAAATLPLLQACTGIGAVSGEMPLNIESDPSGAAVFIMDRHVGDTPLQITQQQLYPVAYDAGKQQAYGNIQLRKAGCEDASQRVRYQDFNKGLMIKLNCGEVTKTVTKPTAFPSPANPRESLSAKPEQVVEPPTATEPAIQPKPPMTEPREAGSEITIKQRLIRLDNLKQEGLINEQEYRQARERILNNL